MYSIGVYLPVQTLVHMDTQIFIGVDYFNSFSSYYDRRNSSLLDSEVDDKLLSFAGVKDERMIMLSNMVYRDLIVNLKIIVLF